MTQKTQNQKKQTRFVNDNILESLRGVGGSVAKTSVDTAAKISSDVVSSLFGSLPTSGELGENQTIEFGKVAEVPRPEAVPAVQPRASDVLRPGQVDMERMRLKQEIAAVRSELKALADSIKNLHTEVTKTVNEVPVEPGIYHVNFFARLRSILRILREQVDDSRTWLALSAQRKQRKLGYWGMFKKHGTSFGLSGERSIATQAG